MRVLSLLAVVLACLDLQGCAMFRHKAPSPDKESKEQKEEKAKVVCPRAEVLADARSLVQFQPGTGRDLTDIEFQAQVNELKSRCKSRDEEASVDITVSFTAWLGPAAQGRTLSVPYFVAVTRGDDILSKESFTADMSFEPEQRQASVAAEVRRLAVPVEGGEQPTEILVGIQLTPEQVAYNRAHGS